jgi:ABC-type nitrate/sulfonate/bicarbonate transport system substrate-binding protein
MSTIDQPLLIANSNYHVGQQVAVYVAKEQGYFREEGLDKFDYDGRGLIPAVIEKQGLGPAMVEHGVDIATAVDVSAAIYQRSLGADVYIVGGWRYDPDLKWYSQKGISHISQLKGKRLGIREREGLVYGFMANLLVQAGIDPEREVTWVFDPVFGYGNDPKHVAMLRDGVVDAMPSFPPFSKQLEADGFPVLMDPRVVFPRRPGKVTVATKRTIESRADELRAYFRGIIRAFWFMRDTANFDYLRKLESRLRSESHNDEERELFIVTSLEKVDGWALPIDGGITAESLKRIIQEMVATGSLKQAIDVEDLLFDSAVRAAYQDLLKRPELQPAHEKVKLAVEKYGF